MGVCEHTLNMDIQKVCKDLGTSSQMSCSVVLQYSQ